MSKRFRYFIAIFSLPALLALGSAPSLHAQAVSIATVTGRVTDQQGAIIGGALVKLSGVETGAVHNAVSNSDGIYTLPSLPIGAYTLQAAVPGFQTYAQTGILLRVGDNVQIDIDLKVGQATETVEVKANAAMLQTQQNTISQVVDQARIVDLPLNGRDATELITLTGASINKSDGTNTGSKSFFSSQSIAIAGGAGNTTNYLLDGGDNNDSFTNVNMPFPFPDALAEFSVETSTLPARYGLHPGGVVNAVTKSGTNRWHGDLFEFLRNGKVNAINYFAPRQDSLKRNQFGGTFGGRIIRDKLFFFGGIQRSSIRQDPSASTAIVPTAAALAGDFSTLNGPGCQARGVTRILNDPTTGLPLPNNRISPSRFDPAAVALAKYLPQTADPCGKASYGIPVQSDETQYIGRVDWVISNRHSLYGRYLLDGYTLAAFFDPHDILVTSSTGNVERAQTFVLGDNFTLNPSTVNSLHLTVGRRSNNRGTNPNGINAASLGVANFYQATTNFLQLAVNNGGFAVGCGTCALGSFPITSYQVANDVDVMRGKHQMAFGVDLLRTRDGQNNHYQDNGVFNFDGRYSNDPLLDFLTGKMNSFSQSGAQLNDLLQNVVMLYAQDTYHLTPKLVVNFGLRWEPLLPEYDRFNRGSTFSRAAFDAGQTSRVFANAPAGSLFYGDPGITNAFTGKRLGNLSPRLGFVYNPDGKGNTTIRAGAALLYDSVGTFVPYRMVAQNPPYGPQVTNTSGPYQFSNPWANVPGGNPFPLPPPGKNVAFPLANAEVFLPPHIHSPSVGQWNLSIQHRFSENWVFSISYLGNETAHLWIGNETNPAVYIPGTCAGKPCSSTSNTQDRRVLTLANPKAGQYYSQMVVANDGISANYNGLLTSIEHRFARNYTLLANYTWSKCLGIAPVTSLGGGVVQDPNNVRGDYGPCSYDAPHLFNASMVYLSEFRRGGVLSHLLSHWNVAPLVRYQSGLPVNPVSGKDNSLTGVGNDRPNVVSNVTYTGAPHGLLYQYINPNLYVPNPIGTYGNAGHNSLRAPGYFDVDVALTREFKVSERLTFHARGEAFNVLNHPNFGAPNANISSSTFGQIRSARDPRILQASMKLIF
ncbi:MAG: carboxypeptidase regulatory-like domain-containing protein [Acidobacteriota bacterium]|nr:carboxypeptidase regulatory-like domain-containing protein [Acidobacteriota bacterium]